MGGSRVAVGVNRSRTVDTAFTSSTPLSIVGAIWMGTPFVQLSRSGWPGSIPPLTAVSSAGSIEFLNDAVASVPRSKDGTPVPPGSWASISSSTKQRYPSLAGPGNGHQLQAYERTAAPGGA